MGKLDNLNVSRKGAETQRSIRILSRLVLEGGWGLEPPASLEGTEEWRFLRGSAVASAMRPYLAAIE